MRDTAPYQLPPIEDAKRQYVELFGSALVMNTYLKIALLGLRDRLGPVHHDHAATHAAIGAVEDRKVVAAHMRLGDRLELEEALE